MKYKSLRKALQGFEKVKYGLTFENVIMKFYTDFLIYSIGTLEHYNNTIAKNIRNIKAFLNWAYEHPQKYNKSTDYKRFKGEGDHTEPIFLTRDEPETD